MKNFLPIIFLFCQLSLAAQQFLPKPHFQHFGTEDGLPSPEVYNAVEDAEGRIWFATDHGLSRFDGYSFQNFTIREGLPESCILRVYKDSRGRLWMVGLSHKLYLLDPAAGFPAYPFLDQTASPPFFGVNPIQEVFWSEVEQKMIFSIYRRGLVEIDSAGKIEIENRNEIGYILKNYQGHWMVSSFFNFEDLAPVANPKRQAESEKLIIIDGNARREYLLHNFLKDKIYQDAGGSPPVWSFFCGNQKLRKRWLLHF